MTGFKDGVADNDLAEDEPVDEPDDVATDTSTQTQSRSSAAGQASDVLVSPPESDSELPWKYRRSSIHDGRTPKQVHLLEETLGREHDALGAVSIDEKVQKADLREAAYLVGLRHLDEVAEQLRVWGYDKK